MRGADDVRRVLATHRPGYRVDAIAPLGHGLDHVAYEVNGELVVRLGHASDPVPAVGEARLLAAVAAVSPLPVPRPVFADDACLAYPKLPGAPLLDWPAADRARLAPSVGAALGGLLAALRAADLDPGLVAVDDARPARWLAEAGQTYAGIAADVPAAHRPRCAMIEDLAYGLRTGRPAYVDKSHRALEWLFSPAGPASRRSTRRSGR